MEQLDQRQDVEIKLVWSPVLLSNGSRFDWYRKTARSFRNREQLTGPKIYRWVFRAADNEVESLYIGQSGDFKARLSKYRAPKLKPNSTEHFLREEVRKCEGRGGRVDLEFLDLKTGSFVLNGRLVNCFSVGDPDVRTMLEDIAIVTAKTEDTRLINRLGGNTYIDEIRRLLERMLDKKHADAAMKIVEE